MLLAVDLDVDFIDIEGVAVTSILSLQSPRINGTELDAPQANRFSGDDDAPLGQEVFDVSVTQIESIVEPDGIADDIGWKSVAFIGVHTPILAIWAG